MLRGNQHGSCEMTCKIGLLWRHMKTLYRRSATDLRLLVWNDYNDAATRDNSYKKIKTNKQNMSQEKLTCAI